MVNRANTHAAGEIDKSNESDAIAVLSYVSEFQTSRRSQSKENQINDELIVSLANAHENRRARQVTEWESLRRQSVERAA